LRVTRNAGGVRGGAPDTQPDNVMLVADPAVPGGVRAKLLDFGIAKLLGERDSPSAQTQTRTGALMGTPVYMSPEQCRGAGGVAERTDVYSLGIMMYQMLVGSPPFQAAGTGELMSLHMYAEPQPIRDRAPQISEDTAALVTAMLAKDPDLRPSMEVVEVELVRLSGAPIGSAVTGAQPVQKPNLGGTGPHIVIGASMVDPFSSTMGGTAINPSAFLTGQTPTPTPIPLTGRTPVTGPHQALSTGPNASLRTGSSTSLRTGTHTPVAVGVTTAPTPTPGSRWGRLLVSGAVLASLCTGGLLLFSQRNGGRAEQLLNQARSDLRDRRWAEAEAHATELLGLEAITPAQRESGLELRVRAEREHRAQTVFEGMRTAEQSGRGDEALRLYQQLPRDSALAAGAQEIYARAAPRVLAAATVRIEAALREGRCEESRREGEQLSQLLPTQPEVQQLLTRPCAVSASSEQAQKTQADARALVTRWTEAHTRGDIGALQPLYAERVLGIYRLGDRASLADRVQWLGERAARLRTPVVLSIGSPRINATAGAARVYFTYVWESTGPEQQRESGRAELFLLREAGALRIAREELVPERPLAQARPAAPPRNPDQFAFVEGMDLVLPTEVDDGWTQGTQVVEPGTDQVRVSRSIDPAQLPADVVRWQGRRVQLYDLDGKRCEARVVGFKVVGRLRPHLLLQKQWQSADTQTVAREAWELTSGSRVLVAGLEGDRNACQGASWARAIELPDPKLEAVREASATLREAALRELRKLPAYAELRAALPKPEVAAPAGRGARFPGRGKSARAPEITNWDEQEGAHVDVSTVTVHGMQLVAVTAQAGAGCIGQSYQLFTLWEVSGSEDDPSLRLLSSPRSGQGGTVRAVVDLDGDGTPELLFVPTSAGELLGVARRRAPGTSSKSVTSEDGALYDDFQVNRLPVLDSSC
jgi:hypothetical protein